ncbi:MAG TPA: septum formation protein Maf [Chloroflexi bacterium]|jgi:septum formation protein|nr:septum formation protein Maf [Chloroflexota bacterium]
MNERSHPPDIVLGSASPRRRELLAAMGTDFDITAADVDETPQSGERPTSLAQRLARSKARAIAVERPDAIIIAADTLVVIDNEILGKPDSADQARLMLARLRDRAHTVLTGLTVLDRTHDRECHQVAVTPVYMRAYADDEVQRYIASGNPMDKAGAYAIQHSGFAPVDHVDDCYANVIGLPMCHLYRVLNHWGRPTPIHPLQSCPLPRAWGYCPWAEAILEAPPETYCADHGRGGGANRANEQNKP